MPSPSLKEFIQRVPVCEQTAGLAAVLDIFSQGDCERLVVVSEEQCPLGVVNLRTIMPHLLIKNPFKKGNYLVSGVAFDVQQPLSQLGLPLIEPLKTLPDKLRLGEFLPYLHASSAETDFHWAVVDSSGKFLGLLNGLRLLKFLASHESQEGAFALTPTEQLPTCEGRHEDLRVTRASNVDPLRLAVLNSNLESAIPNSKYAAPLTSSEQSAFLELQPLIQLLDQLPLPLMLQTGSGKILTQNQMWCQEVGESPESEWVRPPVVTTDRQESEIPLDILVRLRDCGFSKAEGCAVMTVSPVAEAIKAHNLPLTQAADLQTSKTQKSYQDRVWQFVTLPLREQKTPRVEETERWEEGEIRRKNPMGTPLTGFPLASRGKWGDEERPLTQNLKLWLVLAQDVTEQQQVAKELAAKNADLIQLNRMKDEFLACISHELKTPLTSVLGLSSLLKDQVLGQLNERQARYAQLIHQSGRQLMTVVNDILDLTRMETGQLELMPEPVNLPTVCERAFTQAQQLQSVKDDSLPQASQGKCAYESRFSLRIEPGLETIVADELRLRQMLTHLLSNALKFTETHGALGLNISRWDGWIAFTIWDRGIGIPAEKQHLIFQKFQQLENPLTRRFDGTGLGLVLTRRLAQLHGGDVSFISKEGGGSQFTLLLPPNPPSEAAETDRARDQEIERLQPTTQNSTSIEAQAASHKVSENPTLSHRLVLVVEAAPQYIENLSQQLSRLGYRIMIARSGTEALEKARRLSPAAILLNPLLPLLSGWDVLTLLKSDRQTRHIPVLVMATQAEKEQANSSRADGFLNLPVQEEALRKSVTRLTKHKQYINTHLTILRLMPEFSDLNSEADLGLNCRILEADDLEQAELIARVWQPNVVLLDGETLEAPLAYLKQLSSYPYLAALPLVTLDHQTTQAANQVMGLSVFPCLASTRKDQTAALFQVLQVAAGMNWKPNILVVDASLQMDESASSQEIIQSSPPPPSNRSRLRKKLRAEKTVESPDAVLHPVQGWLLALIQYLQTAGYKSLLAGSWTEVLQQLQHQNVDLLLIHLADAEPHPALTEALAIIAQLSNKPPILVLDHRWHRCQIEERFIQESLPSSQLEALLRASATKILHTAPQSMAQLLEQINQTLA